MLIGGRFEVIKELGRGGFGVASLALDRQAEGKKVVLKQLWSQSDARQAAWISRHFRDESKALQRISHTNVASLVAFGAAEDGTPFLAMEFIEGRTLRNAMDVERGSTDLGFAAQVMRELCAGVQAAHDAGIYHRDLKPENVLLQTLGDERERVKIIDFGIATVKEALDEATRATAMAGSIDYMAPEQIEGKPSAASDVFALGIIAYELLTGLRPFNADRKLATVARMREMFQLHRAGVRVKPRDLRLDIPEGAQTAILRALSFDTRSRFPRAEDFGNTLATALQGSTSDKTVAITEPSLDLAHVLFMDIVGYSTLSMDQQARSLEKLQSIVRNCTAYKQSVGQDRVVSLPTGDGMALVFFGDPLAAPRSAVEVGRRLRLAPDFGLRMGLNSGPVYRVADINANRNVAGGGINTAQRVMDCGDAGHILLSQSVADVLLQLDDWRESVADLGVATVKHGATVHVYNLCTADAGNEALPNKFKPSGNGQSPIQAVSTPGQDGPARKLGTGTLARRALLSALASVILISLATIAFRRWNVDPRTNVTNGTSTSSTSVTTASPTPPRPLMSYSFLVGDCGHSATNDSFDELAGSEAAIFRTGEGLRVRLRPRITGHVYLLNEGPPLPAGGPGPLTLLFPETDPTTGRVVEGQQFEYPEPESGALLCFADGSGTETLYLIFSTKPVASLEAIRHTFNEKEQGVVSDAAEVAAILRFLAAHPRGYYQSEPELATKTTVISSSEEVVAVRITLEHRKGR